MTLSDSETGNRSGEIFTASIARGDFEHTEFQREEWRRIHNRRRIAFHLDRESKDRTASSSDTLGADESESEGACNVEDLESSAEQLCPEDLVGVSLSGGGLRSAMFNDGFLQGLSHRGLLRYVDYLCSVSGGGYIASHLATRSGPNGDESNFHSEDQADETESATDSDSRFLPWHFGRDPTNGKIDRYRLKGVGQYLAQPVTAAVCYVTGLVTNALIYLGVLGCFATIAALFWRSFDNPDFRFLLTKVLQFRFGDELLIAFYPAILVGIVYLALFVFRQILHLRAGRRIEGRHNVVDRWIGEVGLVFILSVVISIAVFMGNGKTSISQSSASELFLNQYAQGLLAIAVIAQIVVFFGRDRLFRSERAEAKRWQKGLQRITTVGVVGIVMVSMVHWMAREDISKFTRIRSSYLVLGDVMDWEKGHAVFSLGLNEPSDSDDLEAVDPNAVFERDHWYPRDPWDRHLTNALLSDGSNLLSQRTTPLAPDAEPNPAEIKVLGGIHRFAGIVEAYAYVHGVPAFFDTAVSRQWDRYRQIRKNQSRTLSLWNDRLDDPWFTKELIALANGSGKPTDGDSVASFAPSDFDKEDLETVRTALRDHAIRQRFQMLVERQSASDRFALAATNRSLIDAIFPDMLQSTDIASTLVVPSFDQKSRWQWLLLWSVFLSFGVLMNRFGKSLPSVYGFYRRRIARFFHARPEEDSPQLLTEVCPTDHGLPHPLFLATRMRPDSTPDGYRVDHEPFVFSPIYCGNTGDQDKQWPTQHIRLGARAADVTLSDAVTISGAAVTPLMSGNAFLTMILSFFGTGLGRWLHWNSDSSDRGSHGVRASDMLLFIAVMFYPSLVMLEMMGGVATVSLLFCITVAWFRPKRSDGTIALLRAMTKSVDDERERKNRRENTSGELGHIADGGFCDYLGVTELLRRRCSVIVVSDAGAHLNNESLRPLAQLCQYASSHMGIQILDLDHESALDFRRLELTESHKVHQSFICARVRYPDREETGLMIYCQMAITDRDPLEIQQIRYRFPSFPDEPTTNQFYTNDQVAAYRTLGYHIASQMCCEMQRWTASEIQESLRDEPLENEVTEALEETRQSLSLPSSEQPLFSSVIHRLKTSFRLACYQENSYSKADIFSEAIWSTRALPAPTADSCFGDMVADCLKAARQISEHTPVGLGLDSKVFKPVAAMVCNRWLTVYEGNADVRSQYRDAVVEDINSLDEIVSCRTALLFEQISKKLGDQAVEHQEAYALTMTCHLTTLAVACHEIHQGRPESIFQVGGREKLIALCSELSLALTPMITASATEIEFAVKTLVGELMEMKKCTFQNGERLTTISFAQAIVTMWGRLDRAHFDSAGGSLVDDNGSIRTIESDLQAMQLVVDDIRRDGVELAATQVRIWLHKSLRANRIHDLVRALKKGWCVAYFKPSELSDRGNNPPTTTSVNSLR